MIRAALLLPLVLVGCASTEMRGRGAQAEAVSLRSVADLEACTTVQMSKMRGYEIRTSEANGSAKVTLVMRITGVPATVAAIDITDTGPQRHLAGFATGKQTGGLISAVRTTIASCAG